MSNLKAFKADYNWIALFCFANGEQPDPRRPAGDEPYAPTSGNAAGALPVDVDSRDKAAPFWIGDVESIIDSSEGERDERHWQCVVLLRDTRYAFLDGGCDYTGWDCRSSAEVLTADSLEKIERKALTDEARERLPGVHAALVVHR